MHNLYVPDTVYRLHPGKMIYPAVRKTGHTAKTNPLFRTLLGGVLLAALSLHLLSCDSGGPAGLEGPQEELAIPWTTTSTIVCMGTSLTFGYGTGCRVLPRPADCAADSAYPTLLQQRLRIPVINLGVPFATSAGGVQLLDEALAHDPALVLLEFGANDLFQGLPAETVRANLVTMIEFLQNRGVRVALLSFIHPDMIPNTPAGHRLADLPDQGMAYHAMLTDLVDEYGLPTVDYILAEVWWDADLMYDDVHPNGQGYLKMEENIFRGLREIFAASGMLR